MIRPARRPPGWVAPGPAPCGDTSLTPEEDEDLCFLAGDWRLFQKRRGHRWSLDDLVTAAFAVRVCGAAPSSVLDLGCGIGSVLLMLAWRFPQAECVGVEAQELSVGLARRSIAFNGARARVVHGDLREVPLERSFSLVTGTPPYFPLGTGTPPGRVQAPFCLFEHRGGPEDYLAAMGRALADDGVGVICASVLQRQRVFGAASQLGLDVFDSLDVVPRAGKSALLVCFAIRRGFQRPLTPALSPLRGEGGAVLTVRDAEGQWTPEFAEMRALFGMPPRVA